MQKQIKKIIPRLIGLRLNILYTVRPENALQALYQLSCEPRKGRLQEEELPKFLQNAEREMIVNGEDKLVIYRWKNSGKKILLVHGWESNSKRWEEAVERLHKLGYELIAFDAPAQGLSSGKELHVPLFAECIQAVQNKYHAHIAIGHSAGAMSLIYHAYAYTQENKFEKLVLLGAPSDMTRIIDDMAHMLRLKSGVIQDLDKIFKKKFGFYFDEFSIARFAKSVKTPSMIIHDKYDRVAPVSEAYDIAENLENAELLITEWQGHSLNKTPVIDSYVDYITTEKQAVNE